MRKLTQSFYHRDDVVQLAQELLGKILVTKFDGRETSGRIVETEAYNGEKDRASHAYGGRRTSRTEIMYARGGMAYVYLCYGIHHLFNVVTSEKNVPHAILIRALEPLKGIDTMLERTGKKNPDTYRNDYTLTKGPGNVSKALGIHTKHSGISLLGMEILIADDRTVYSKREIGCSPRIGVGYAGKDADLMYRFFVKGNPYVSGKPV
jgi:DNA-3-methyladenine glycosylase